MQGERRALAPSFSGRKIEVLDLAEANGANYAYTANVTGMSQLREIQVTNPGFQNANFPSLFPLNHPQNLAVRDRIPTMQRKKFLHG